MKERVVIVMSFFLPGLLAHLTGDFILQPASLNAKKEQGRCGAYLQHGLVIFVLTGLAVSWYGVGEAVFFAAAVTAGHLLVDVGKTLTGHKTRAGTRLFLFLTDQALHLTILVLCGQLLLPNRPDPQILAFYSRIIPGETLPALAAGVPGAEQAFTAGLQTVVIYVTVLFAGAVLIERMLEWLTEQTPVGKTGRLGKAVGILERLVLLTLVAVEALPALGFVLAAKSLARYQELNNREFAEYYLVGTLASFALAFFGGLGLQAVLQV